MAPSTVPAVAERPLRSVCAFAGSSVGARPDYAEAAAALGREVGARGLRLVYGGGAVGLMGVLADAALEAGAEVVGVIPEHLDRREVAHRGVTRLEVVGSMHARKARMADLADAFVLLPGGIGSVEEFVEVLTWTQLGIHDKPAGILDVAGYWQPLLGLLERAEAEGFLRPEHRAMVVQAREPAALVDALASATVPDVEKWLDLDER